MELENLHRMTHIRSSLVHMRPTAERSCSPPITAGQNAAFPAPPFCLVSFYLSYLRPLFGFSSTFPVLFFPPLTWRRHTLANNLAGQTHLLSRFFLKSPILCLLSLLSSGLFISLLPLTAFPFGLQARCEPNEVLCV